MRYKEQRSALLCVRCRNQKEALQKAVKDILFTRKYFFVEPRARERDPEISRDARESRQRSFCVLASPDSSRPVARMVPGERATRGSVLFVCERGGREPLIARDPPRAFCPSTRQRRTTVAPGIPKIHGASGRSLQQQEL